MIGFEIWLDEIEARLEASPVAAPFGVNLIIHKSNPRVQADLEVVVRRKIPVVITSLGAAPQVVEAVHSYGGLVFHDVISRRHAEKAAAAGVDGIIAVAAGAGGHVGSISPFALVAEVREVFDGILILSGAMSTGADILAARTMGADLAYMGTRFIATRESLVSADQKAMMLQAQASDILYTPAISGVNANFMRPSVQAAGLNPDALSSPGTTLNMESEAKAWKAVWSAGQGVGSIRDLPTAADLCHRLVAEYRAGIALIKNDPFPAEEL